MGRVLRGEVGVTMPQTAIRNRKFRFSTPVQGLGKVSYQTSSVEIAGPWARPTPLIIQHRAAAIERAALADTISRVGVLLAVDLLILFLAHALVDAARTSTIFSGALADFLSELIPRGSFPRVEVLTAVISGLAIFGNYRGRGAWHKGLNLVAGSTLGLSLVFWSRIWTDITLERVVGFAVVLGAVVTALSCGRYLLFKILERVRPTPTKVSRAVIIGSLHRAEVVKASDSIRLNKHVSVVGHVTLDGSVNEDSLGTLSDLVWIIERHSVDTIILADHFEDDVLYDVLDVAERTGCSVLLGSPLFPVGGFVPRVVTRGNIPYITVTRPSLRLPQLVSKRAFDVIAASILLVMLAPLFAVIALTVRLSSAGPAFFRQRRVGYGGKEFNMYKFRSMVKDAEALKGHLQKESIYSDARLFKIPNDPRITRVGRFLRRSSLDELPQLWNVLRGEMSLVGPRPPLVSEVETYEEHNYTRFDMKPGITGPWQVAGRNRITSFDEVVALETDYLVDWSLVKDFAILMRTIPTVLSMSGAV